jgi:hypothetical protein
MDWWESERRSCDNVISVAFSYEEMHRQGTRSLVKMDGNLTELQKQLVTFQIYVSQRNCYHAGLFRSLNRDKDISSASTDPSISEKKKHCFV